jgi:hypothetical protein
LLEVGINRARMSSWIQLHQFFGTQLSTPGTQLSSSPKLPLASSRGKLPDSTKGLAVCCYASPAISCMHCSSPPGSMRKYLILITLTPMQPHASMQLQVEVETLYLLLHEDSLDLNMVRPQLWTRTTVELVHVI